VASIADHLAGPAVRLHDGGPEALNVVILGDGFTADNASMTAYRAAADAVASRLLASPPFGALADALTIIRVDSVSDEAGIDVPATCGGQSYNPDPPTPTTPPFKWARSEKHPANILGTSWCASAAVTSAEVKYFLNSSSPNVSLFALSAGVVPGITIVLVNDWMFGATAWPDPGVVFVSIGQNLVGDVNPRTGSLLQPNDPGAFPDVAVHEVGHLEPFLLLDEYSKGLTADQLDTQTRGIIDSSPNLTTTLPPPSWQGLVAPGTPEPTDCDVIQPDAGAVPGGYWFDEGVYHAACACRMNDTYDAPFCVVCRQQILAQLAPYLPPMQTQGRAVQEAAWIVLDGLRIETGGPGYYTIDYMVAVGARTVRGVWPPGRPMRLERGHSVAIGVLVGTFPMDVAPELGSRPEAPWAILTYQLKKWRLPDGQESATVLASERMTVDRPVRPRTDGGRIFARNAPTHRLTVGVAVR
jgi:hypothetical protein